LRKSSRRSTTRRSARRCVLITYRPSSSPSVKTALVVNVDVSPECLADDLNRGVFVLFSAVVRPMCGGMYTPECPEQQTSGDT
jgi:hypothetical protein